MKFELFQIHHFGKSQLNSSIQNESDQRRVD